MRDAVSRRKLSMILGAIAVAAILLVGGRYLYSVSPALRRILAPVVLRPASLWSARPTLLLPDQGVWVRMTGILEKTPQAAVSYYRLVGLDWTIGLDVSQLHGVSMKDLVGSVVTVEGIEKRLLFIQKSPSGGPGPMPQIEGSQREGTIVFVRRLTY